MDVEVELREIRVFLICAEELHFGRAAARLRVNPSGISQTIARLERRFGAVLFERTSRRVVLTAHGVRVRDELGPRYADLIAAIRGVVVGTDQPGGVLRVGFFGMSGGRILTTLIQTFQQRHAACTVELVDLTHADPIGRLRRAEVDVMTCWLPVDEPGLVIGPLASCEPRAVAVAADHPLAARDRVGWDDLADFAVADVPGLPAALRETLVPSATPSGLQLRRGIAVHSMAEVCAAVARGQIVHPTTASSTQFHGHPNLVLVPLADAAPMRSAFIHLDVLPSAALRAFLECAALGAASEDCQTPAPPANLRRSSAG